MLKFGTPTIALPLAIKKCTVQTGCTVYIYKTYYTSQSGIWPVISRVAWYITCRRRVQIHLTSEITSPYSTTRVISDLFYT